MEQGKLVAVCLLRLRTTLGGVPPQRARTHGPRWASRTIPGQSAEHERTQGLPTGRDAARTGPNSERVHEPGSEPRLGRHAGHEARSSRTDARTKCLHGLSYPAAIIRRTLSRHSSPRFCADQLEARCDVHGSSSVFPAASPCPNAWLELHHARRPHNVVPSAC